MNTASDTRRRGPSASGNRAGDLLRQWREDRHRSQFNLALDVGVSARHLSFVETGRSQPSRGLLLALADELDVPLRERNVLMLAAGYAPGYAQSEGAAALSGAARDALEHLLAGHEPYPAVAFDRWGDIVLTNAAIAPLLEGVDATLLEAPINLYRLSLHPDGLARHIGNRAQWAAHLGHRLTRLARITQDGRLLALLQEIREYPGVAPAIDERHQPSSADLLLTLHVQHSSGDLRLITTVTTFGGPSDVALSELGIESFFPADTQTKSLMHALQADNP